MHGTERAEEHVGDGAIHRFAHQQREQRSRCADERARDDEHVVVEHEARQCRREARERVEQRDHDRHVRAADRQHEEHAEQQREAERDAEEQQRIRLIRDDHAAAHDDRDQHEPR